MIQTYIISAFPGTGKSYFHKNHPNISLDSDSSEFSWIINESGDKIRNPEFPKNYINHIKENIGKYKFIFVSSHKEVRDLLNLNCIFYYLVYPEINSLSDYVKRYEERGSSKEFIDLVSKNWRIWLKELKENEGSFNHELRFNQTLTEYLEYF